MNEDQLEQALVAVLDHYGWPEPRYGEHPMKCPVHDDRVASASVNRTKGLWNCHACGKGGTAVTIVMEREGKEFPEAVSFVEGLTGGSLRVERPRPTRKTGGKRWVPPRLRSAG